MVTDGDLTKRNDILWNYPYDVTISYAKFQLKKTVFQECILAYLQGETKDQKIKDYCIQCRNNPFWKEEKCKDCSEDKIVFREPKKKV